jgi:hypothetical protein
MNTSQLPVVIYHNLDELIKKAELETALTIVQQQLHKGHITSILNAFLFNTKICINGIPYIKVTGLANILRTGTSGAERPLVYQGIERVISSAELIEIEGHEYISGPSLIGLINARTHFVAATTKQYLEVATQTYYKIINLSQIRDLKEIFLDEIRNNRPYLKRERIEVFSITQCEFTGQYFNHRNEVEFAHIESVSTNPFKALDITNGVIILKHIHEDLTKRKIHNFDEMYNYCLEKKYSRIWADNI